MTLEKTFRFVPRVLVSVLPALAVALALFGCSSDSTPDSPAGAAGTSSPTGGNPGAGTGGNPGATAGTSPSAGTAGTPTGGGSSSAGSTSGGSTSAGAGGSGGVATGGVAGGAGTGAVGGGQGGGGPGMCTTVADFATWPSGKGPSDIGKLAVENFKSHTGDAYGGAGYAWTFTYVGSLQFTKLIADVTSNTKLIMDFERYASGSTMAPNNAPPDAMMPLIPATVDDRAFGDLPLEIFMENQDARSKTLGLDRADAQWSVTTSDGITRDARYWADDMFMITGLQVYAYRATQDVKYRDRAAKTMIAYLAALQQADGHFWHTKQSKAYWGRANGWIAAGMTELLLDLPAGADRDAVMAGYKKQMDGLLAVQIASGADAGSWRQVLDLSSAQPESSCTAMFTFALVTGVRNGWLTDAKYAAAARNGWLALGNKTNASGVLDKVCPGTSQADPGTLQQQQAFYTGITFGANDQHGQAPLLWAARALLRPDCPGVR